MHASGARAASTRAYAVLLVLLQWHFDIMPTCFFTSLDATVRYSEKAAA